MTQSTFIFHGELGHVAKPNSSQQGSQGPRGHFITLEATHILFFLQKKRMAFGRLQSLKTISKK